MNNLRPTTTVPVLKPSQAKEDNRCLELELAHLRNILAEAQRTRISIQRELELVKQIRAEAERYQQETETRARSQYQITMLQARTGIRKEIAEYKRRASEEIQKMLGEMHLLRLAAQKELDTQRKLHSASRINALSIACQNNTCPEPVAEQEVRV